MKLITKLPALIERCFTASTASGWWSPRPDQGQQLMLAVSELSEALEAVRSKREFGGITEFDKLMELPNKQLGEGGITAYMASAFKNTIKDMPNDELADCYIRLCDYIGGFGLCPERVDGSRKEWFDTRRFSLPENFGHCLLQISAIIAAADPMLVGSAAAARQIGGAMAMIECLCFNNGIDLALHIDLKLKYNATRGEKHGDKLF